MRHITLLFCLAVLLALAAPAAARPPGADICFQQVPSCISGRFAQYWRENGGLAVFGLPISASSKQRTGDDPTTYLVQFFERARFELHPKETRPYDVLLGRLGADGLAAQGRDWQSFPKDDPAAPHYFAETGHAIDPHFWDFWAAHGLELDGNKAAISQAESLALFGMPISPAQPEVSADSQSYLTQWYERARFEYHPDSPAPYTVQLGLLGADALQRSQQPQDAATPAPADGLPGIPPISGACVQNAPPAAEGPQAWVTVPEPTTESQFNSICARLILGGQVVTGVHVSSTLHYRRKNVGYGPIKPGDDGVAEQGFNIGSRKLANRNIAVPIDVTFALPDGSSYAASTSFTPRFPK